MAFIKWSQYTKSNRYHDQNIARWSNHGFSNPISKIPIAKRLGAFRATKKYQVLPHLQCKIIEWENARLLTKWQTYMHLQHGKPFKATGYETKDLISYTEKTHTDVHKREISKTTITRYQKAPVCPGDPELIDIDYDWSNSQLSICQITCWVLNSEHWMLQV